MVLLNVLFLLKFFLCSCIVLLTSLSILSANFLCQVSFIYVSLVFVSRKISYFSAWCIFSCVFLFLDSMTFLPVFTNGPCTEDPPSVGLFRASGASLNFVPVQTTAFILSNHQESRLYQVPALGIRQDRSQFLGSP